jgi:hypothetical protein
MSRLVLIHARVLLFLHHTAGIQAPPVSRLVYQYRPEQFLERLAKQRVLVSFQLLARLVPVEPKDPSPPPKRQMVDVLPELENSDDKQHETTIRDINSYNEQQVAICRLSYRPTLWQLFSTDIAETLIAAGNASVSSSVLTTNVDLVEGVQQKTTKIVDSSQRIQDLRHDVKYLDRLAKTEFEAAKKSMGMWSVPEVRESKREVVEEVEFQTKANIFQKLWRRFRGG